MTKPPYHPNGKKAESNNPLTWSHFITAKAAALTGRAVSTLRNERFLRRGLPYFKIGRRSVRYKLTDIITFMEARRITFDQDGGVGHD